jgi:hypothetical protein
MQLLYNSDSYAVVQFDLPAAPAAAEPATAVLGGFEIVDKLARREVFIQGALAERFRAGVQSLAETGPSEDQYDEFIAGFTVAATQPVVLH